MSSRRHRRRPRCRRHGPLLREDHRGLQSARRRARSGDRPCRRRLRPRPRPRRQARRAGRLPRRLHRADGAGRRADGGAARRHAAHLHRGADAATARCPCINIVDVLAAELNAARLRRVALFGSIFTVQGSLWGQLAGVEIVKPQPDEIAFIGQAYQRILDTQRADAGRRRRAAPHRRRPAAARRRRDDPARRHRPRGDVRRGDAGFPASTWRACTSTPSSSAALVDTAASRRASVMSGLEARGP